MFSDAFFVANVGGGARAHAEELSRASRSFAVVGLLETGFRRTLDAQCCLARLYPDHRVLGLMLQDETGVGCALLVHRHVRVRRYWEVARDRHRLLSVEVELRGRLLSLAALYVPAEGSGGSWDAELLRSCLARRCSVVAGDLNARSEALGCRTTNAHGEALADFLLEEGGHEAVVLSDPGEPSFVHRSAPFADTIDWAISSPAASRFLRAQFGDDLGADHLPLLVRFSTPARATLRSSEALRWRTTCVTDWGPFQKSTQRHLEEADLLEAAPPTTPQELDDSVATLQDALQAAADATLARSRPIADSGHRPFPWWIVQLIRIRNRLRRQLARQPSEDLRRRLRDTRTLLQQELEAYRKSLLESKARLLAAGPKRQSRLFWQAVGRWFRSSQRDLPPLACADGSTAVSPPERAEAFATYCERTFAGAADPSFDDFRARTEAAVTADTRLLPLDSTDLAGEEDFQPDDPCRPVSPAEVSLALSQLRAGKATGPDGLAPDILRHATLALASILADVFTASLRLGYLPLAWRHSALRLLPKQGKPLTEPAHFRPIALCSCIGKLLERIFARRLQRVCLRRHLLPPQQSAFLPARDTTEQLVVLTQRVGQALNAGLTTTLVALDANKAFDSVWHAGLLRLLRERQLSAATQRWVASFLRHRSAVVLEDGTFSRRFSITAGVPQGSPLSPLLYIFFTAEMPLPSGPGTGASLYADDVAMWATGPSPTAALQRIRPALHRAVRWGRRWRLTFNPAKTQLGFFSRRTAWPLDALAPPQLLGVEQTWANCVDLLGVRLARRLSFAAHVRRQQERLAPRILDLRRWTWAYRSVPPWVGALLFRTLLRPAYTYAAPVLLLATPTARRQLRRLDRRGMRAGLRQGLACPLTRLSELARAPALDRTLTDLGGRFLLRAAETDHRRVLAAFSSLARQQPGVARHDCVLERLYAGLSTDDRSTVRQALHRLGVFPGAGDSTHPGRNRRTLVRGTDPRRWGISPFDDEDEVEA